MQVKCLFDMTGMTADSSFALLSSANNSWEYFLGPQWTSNSEISISFYNEANLVMGQVKPITITSGFAQASNELLLSSFQASYLLTPQNQTISTPTHFLDTATQMVDSADSGWNESTTFRVIVLVSSSPNLDFGNVGAFIKAAMIRSVLPIFVNPLATNPWQASMASIWSNAFTVPLPLCNGISSSTSNPWTNFNLDCAIQLATTISSSASLIPTTSDSSLVVVSTPSFDASTSILSLPLAISWNSSLLSSVGNVYAHVSFIGWPQVTIQSNLNYSAYSSNSFVTINNFGQNLITIRGYGFDSVQINSLPTNGGSIADLQNSSLNVGSITSTSIYYSPPNQGLSLSSFIDSFSYSLSTSCGIAGSFTVELNFSQLAFPLILNSTSSLYVTTLTEDDTSNHTLSFQDLIVGSYSDVSIMFSNLPMGGTSFTTNGGSPVSVGTWYPLSLYSFIFHLLGASRGPAVLEIQALLQNSKGSLSAFSYTINITDVSHSPTIAFLSTSLIGTNFMFASDIDGDPLSLTVNFPSLSTACYWMQAANTCSTSGSWSVSTGLSAFPISATSLLPDGQFVFTVSDGFSAPVEVVANSLTGSVSNLLGVPNIITSLPSTGGIIPISLQPLTTMCFFPVLPNFGSLIVSGSFVTSIVNMTWDNTMNSVQYVPMDNYGNYPAFVGKDQFALQCMFGNLSPQVTPIQIFQIQLPILPPVAPNSTITLPTFVSFGSQFTIPVNGISFNLSDSLVAQIVSTSSGSAVVDSSGQNILFTPSQAGDSNVAYSMCYKSQPSICSATSFLWVMVPPPAPTIPNQQQITIFDLTSNVVTFDISCQACYQFQVTSISPWTSGTLTSSQTAVQSGGLYNNFTIQFDFSGIPSDITSASSPIASFTYMEINRLGFTSTSAVVTIWPNVTQVEQIVLQNYNQLYNNATLLQATLSALISNTTQYISPLISTPIDVFGVSGLSSLNQPAGTILLAEISPTLFGNLSVCFPDGSCADVFSTMNISVGTSVFYTPILGSSDSDLNWTVRLVDQSTNATLFQLYGYTKFATNALSSFVDHNLAQLQFYFPGSKLLTGSANPGLCYPTALLPFSCIAGILTTFGDVIISAGQSISFTTLIVQIQGDLTIGYGSSAIFEVIETSPGTISLPFVNVSGNVYVEGNMTIPVNYAQFQLLAEGLKRSSQPYDIMQANNISSDDVNVLLPQQQPAPNPCDDYSSSSSQSSNGNRATLSVLFDFTSSGCNNPSRENNTIKWIIIGCVVGGVIVIVASVVLFVVVKSDKARKAIRPFSTKRQVGPRILTQKTKSLLDSSTTSTSTTPASSPPETPHSGGATNRLDS